MGNDLLNLGENIAKSLLAQALRGEATKLINKDTNNIGKDDAEGKALNALASAVDTINFSDNPTALRNLGNALIAAGNQLIGASTQV